MEPTPQPEKPKRKKNNEETRITNQIKYWLGKQEACWFFKVGATKRGVVGRQKPGIPDLYCCYQGRHVWFEIKRPGNTLQPIQKEQIEKMVRAGAEVFIVHSLDELKTILQPIIS